MRQAFSTTRAATLISLRRRVANSGRGRLEAAGAQPVHEPIGAGMQDQAELVGPRAGYALTARKATGRAFDRQIGRTRKGDRYADCRIRTGFDVNRRYCYATRDREWSSGDRNVITQDLLSYNLRTLLHRNDTVRMAASIEARFPFLGEALVKTAINLSKETQSKEETPVPRIPLRPDSHAL